MNYFDTVWAGLHKMPVRGQLVIEKSVKPENRPQFVEAVKAFIDLDGGGDGFYVEFTNDYSKVRKFSK